MTEVLSQLPPESRVAFIRLRSLGDCILTTPAIALLKQTRPDLQLSIVVDPVWMPLYEKNPHLSAVLPAHAMSVRNWKPALVLNLHGGTTSAALTAISGARWRAAWSHLRFRSLYNVHLPTAQQVLGVARPVHTAEHAASAVFALGVPPQAVPGSQLFAHPPAAARKPYALIHPFASAPAKTWDANHFLQIAEFFRNEARLEPLILGSAADDLSRFRRYTVIQGQPLQEVMSLSSGAALFLGNDSGPAHIAAAFGVPSVVLFGPSNPAIWGPWRTPCRVLQSEIINEIRVAQVRNAVLDLGAREIPQVMHA